MSDTLKLANSIWPNGMKVDSDGHAVFYPLGTNKVDVPTNSPHWPKGDKLVSPFVYQNDKLVGFCDTKAMVGVNGSTIIMPYEHIEVDFSSIKKDSIQIHAPKATTKTVIWKNSNKEDIADVNYKYKGCTTVDEITAVNKNYITTDIVDGTWNEFLSDLENSSGMFDNCSALTSFESDLSSLTDGGNMFIYCSKLTTFTSDLSSLTSGRYMFDGCYNLTTFNSDLSSLTDGSSMFSGCSKLTTFTSDLSSLTSGGGMFSNCVNLTTFESDLSSLTSGIDMFRDCSSLTTFTSDLSSLTSGIDMFSNCVNLTTFESDLSSLTSARSMFQGCSSLTTFTSDLSSLNIADCMFQGCSSLTTFTSDLSSLTSARGMFCDCTNLTTFTSDLRNLRLGGIFGNGGMFGGCSKLTTFTSDLSSLTNGQGMFKGCSLNTESIACIAETIQDVHHLTTDSNSSFVVKQIHIGIANEYPTEEEHKLLTKIYNKGWEVFVNGSDTAYAPADGTVLIPIDGEQTTAPKPYWAKPVPATEEEANYIDENGNFFNILGGQFIYVSDPETYGMFTCEEDAAANMRLTPYIKPQTEIENQ